MKFKIRILLLTVFLTLGLTTGAIAADDVTARASIDRKSILIGDRIKYTLEARAGKNIELEFPKFADGKMGDFEIKDEGSRIKTHLFGARTVLRWYYITAYSAGAHDIPQYELKFRKKSSKDWSVKKVPSIGITVGSVLPKGVKLSDIKDIKGPISFWNINWLLVFVVLVFIAVFVIAYIIYNKRKYKKPVRFPHETALEEIEACRAAFLRGGNAKDYHVGISDTIRRYIERVFNLRAPEMTTEEFLNSVKDSTGLSPEQKGLLGGFMNACDLVKFAKYVPERAEIETVYLAAKKFVEETKTKYAHI